MGKEGKELKFPLPKTFIGFVNIRYSILFPTLANLSTLFFSSIHSSSRQGIVTLWWSKGTKKYFKISIKNIQYSVGEWAWAHV